MRLAAESLTLIVGLTILIFGIGIGISGCRLMILIILDVMFRR
jgi:hypothetical protein